MEKFNNQKDEGGVKVDDGWAGGVSSSLRHCLELPRVADALTERSNIWLLSERVPS